MSITKMILYTFFMALVTYLIRVCPLLFFRKKIQSGFINSLLYYIPYTVLASMTFPYIFYATGKFIPALVGTIIAVIASVCKKSLIVVAILSCVGVLAVNLIYLL